MSPLKPSVTSAVFALACVLATPQPGRADPIKDAQDRIARAKAEAKAAAKPQPLSDTPSSYDCSINAEGNGSRDCDGLLKNQFDALATLAGLQGKVKYSHRGVPGIILGCSAQGDAVVTEDGIAPAEAKTCPNDSMVATSNSIFYLVRSCTVDGVQTDIEDSMASILAHEIAHIASNHSKDWADEQQKVCDPWFAVFQKSEEGKKLGKAINAAYAGKPQEQIKAARTGALIDACIKNNKSLQTFAQKLESDADADGQNLMRSYGGKQSEAAFICTMKGIGDYMSVVADEIPADAAKTHPDAAARVTAAKRAYGHTMISEARAYCAKHPESPICRLVD